MRGVAIDTHFIFVNCRFCSVYAVLLVTLIGCSSSEQSALPEKLTAEEIASLPRVDGQPLGHLKPLPPGKTPWPAGHTPPSYLKLRPHVRWILDGDQLTELDPPERLDSFRLDFDETHRLSFDDLPYAFMTEKGREVVVRRGDVIEGHFMDERISPDEKIVPVFSCNNPECPQGKKTRSTAHFPYDPASEKSPTCPFCNSKNASGESTRTQRFKTSQYRGLEKQIYRQFYRDRERKKNQE